MNSQPCHDALTHLGGWSRVAAMIGVKNAVDLQDGVGIRFAAKASNGANHVEIRVDAATDTYTVTFWKISRNASITPKMIGEFRGVFAEALRQTFEAQTGLSLTL